MQALGPEHPESKYPCVYADNRATVRVVAPDAQKVTVWIGRGSEMAKGPDGIWTVTTTPLVVGFHYFTLQIMGPLSPIRPPTPTSVPDGRTAQSRSRSRRTWTITAQRRAARSRCSAVVLLQSHRQVAPVFSSTRRRITRPTSKGVIPFCICCTAGAMIRPAGSRRATWRGHHTWVARTRGGPGVPSMIFVVRTN